MNELQVAAQDKEYLHVSLVKATLSFFLLTSLADLCHTLVCMYTHAHTRTHAHTHTHLHARTHTHFWNPPDWLYFSAFDCEPRFWTAMKTGCTASAGHVAALPAVAQTKRWGCVMRLYLSQRPLLLTPCPSPLWTVCCCCCCFWGGGLCATCVDH